VENNVVSATCLEHRLDDSTNLSIVGGADRECPDFDISDRSVCHALYNSQEGHFCLAVDERVGASVSVSGRSL